MNPRDPTCDAGQRDSEATGVNRAMARLHGLVGKLDEWTTVVSDSLAVVLREPNPTTAGSDQPQEPACKLAAELAEHCDRIERAVDRLTDINDRLDL